MEYTVERALELFASPFVDDAAFTARLGGGKQDAEAIARYLALPVLSRPDIAAYFDSAWYVLRYPDIAEGAVDPLLHFIGWGAEEDRAPHPLIDPRFMRQADPDLLPDALTIDALLDALDNDRTDPSPRFARDFYRAQLEEPEEAARGLLRHFLAHGLLRGLRPAPGLDPLAAWRDARERTLDIRAGLREFALRPPGPTDAVAEPPGEGPAKALFLANAHALLPGYGRTPLDFDLCGQRPAVSVAMVVHNRFALTMAALASLRSNIAAPVELLLIDSGSTDETRHIQRYLGGAQVVRVNENVGFVHGCNTALRLASADAVLFLNNDLELAPGAVDAALARLGSDPAIGAVGGKLIRVHGALQEAGGIVWRDGQTAGYMRDASPLAPEANFVRDVDYCSGAFLLVRAALLRDLGGFDEAFAPGYYEDADLCLRIQEAGHKVIYDPAIVVRHLEHGSSDQVAGAVAAIAARRDVFFRKHRARLRFRYPADARAPLFARAVAPGPGRVLFIEDRVPLRRLGQGFVRSNDILHALSDTGRHVTVYPMYPSREDVAAVYADMPERAEVMYDRGLRELDGFLKSRRGYYDTIWIGRTHNLDRIKPVLERGGMDVVGGVRLVLDTEAIVALRDAARQTLAGGPLAGGEPPVALDDAIRAEFGNAWFCQALVAVNEAEAARLRSLGFGDVQVLGHARHLALTERPFSDRAGLLFVGAMAEPQSPNCDALAWFVDAVLPLVEAELGYQTRLTVAGFAGAEVDLSRFAAHPRISLRGCVPDLAALYDRHRVFVAPTRYAAGVPYKVHEAASFGLPVVATDLLRDQLGWQDGGALLSAPADDPAGFARAILRLYGDEALWASVRAAAAARVAAECDAAAFRRRVAEIVGRGPGSGGVATPAG